MQSLKEIIEGDPSLISNGFITFRDFDPGDTVSFTGATLQSVEAVEKAAAYGNSAMS